MACWNRIRIGIRFPVIVRPDNVLLQDTVRAERAPVMVVSFIMMCMPAGMIFSRLAMRIERTNVPMMMMVRNCVVRHQGDVGQDQEKICQ